MCVPQIHFSFEFQEESIPFTLSESTNSLGELEALKYTNFERLVYNVSLDYNFYFSLTVVFNGIKFLYLL